MEFATRMQSTSATRLAALFAGGGQDVISFAGGYPDASLFPQAALDAAFARTFQKANQTLLQYTEPQGFGPLRAKLAARMNQAGIPATAETVLMTQGAQQGIDLVARLMLDPGAGLVVEGPTYVGALSAFDAYQPTYYEVPVAADGMDLAALKRVLMTHPVKLIYTVPDFQNPTGTVMSLAKRQALIALANTYDVLILEDAPYRDLRYRGTALPPLAALDTENRVVHLGSFSKILAPSLRLGWLTAAPALMTRLVGLKGSVDVSSSNLMMQAVDDYLTHHDLDAHIATVKRAYQEKMQLMRTTLLRYLPDTASFTQPEGGFFLWLTVEAPFDMNAFMQAHLLPEAGVIFVPEAVMHSAGGAQNSARLNFTNPSLAQIAQGAKALGLALQRATHKTAAR